MKRRDSVTTAIAADYLQCSTRHVQRLFWRGDLLGYFKGDRRGLMIYKSSLEGWKNREVEE